MNTLILTIIVLTFASAAAARHWPTLPAWWLRQADCIHRHEAVNWHEKRNAVSRGGMQFIWSTWASLGGRGDPADASPGEQLWRAWMLWNRDGGSWREWTTARGCGLR